jgi:hypothetical protein
MKIEHKEKKFIFNGETWSFDKKIYEVRVIEGTILIIFDWMEWPKDKLAPNLEAYDLANNKLWTAENIGMGGADAWVGIHNEKPLQVHNFAGYLCDIDIKKGKVLKSQFTK